MKVLTTFAFGDQSDLLDISLPTFRRYASLHNYHLYIPPSQPLFERPWAWAKIPLLISLLSVYDTVLWLDADIVVMDYTKDILDDCSDAPINLVVHYTEEGEIPNTGVFIARRSAIPIFEKMWDLNNFRKTDGWWEQAAFISVAGGDPDAVPTSTPPSDMWSSLPYEWNPIRHDFRSIPDNPRFFHATMFPNKAEAMKIAAEYQVFAD